MTFTPKKRFVAQRIAIVLRQSLLAGFLFSPFSYSTTLSDAILAKIDTHYIEPSLANELKAHFPDTSDIQDQAAVADILTEYLTRFDKHFTVEYLPPEPPTHVTTAPSWFDRLEQDEYGFTHYEVIESNIGYVNFWGFARLTRESRLKVQNVMDTFTHVEGLIIDLRQNGGGSGEMVSWLSSYFLNGRVHMNSFYTRTSNSLHHFYTNEDIDNDHLETIPLYILTSHETFSAAEEFAYNLQQLNRATIVGETSKGGANPWRWFTIPGYDYRIGIPTRKAINPITHSNWEGVGVAPDIQVSEDDALETAISHLRGKLAGIK